MKRKQTPPANEHPGTLGNIAECSIDAQDRLDGIEERLTALTALLQSARSEIACLLTPIAHDLQEFTGWFSKTAESSRKELMGHATPEGGAQ